MACVTKPSNLSFCSQMTEVSSFKKKPFIFYLLSGGIRVCCWAFRLEMLGKTTKADLWFDCARQRLRGVGECISAVVAYLDQSAYGKTWCGGVEADLPNPPAKRVAKQLLRADAIGGPPASLIRPPTHPSSPTEGWTERAAGSTNPDSSGPCREKLKICASWGRERGMSVRDLAGSWAPTCFPWLYSQALQLW